MAFRLPPDRWVRIETESVGAVLVGRLTMGALGRLDHRLRENADANDEQVARWLLEDVCRLPDEAAATSPPTASLGVRLGTQDVARLAEAFLDVTELADRDQLPRDPTSAAAVVARREVERIVTATRGLREAAERALSPATRELLAESQRLNEDLQRIVGEARWAQPAGQCAGNAGETVGEVLKSTDSLKRFGGKTGILDWERSMRFPAPPPLPIMSADVQVTARLKGLDDKACQMLEIAQFAAASSAKTSDAVTRALTEFEVRHQADARRVRLSLWLASGALVAAIGFPLLGFVQDYLSNRESDAYQARIEQLMEEQVATASETSRTTKELLARIERAEEVLIRSQTAQPRQPKVRSGAQ